MYGGGELCMVVVSWCVRVVRWDVRVVDNWYCGICDGGNVVCVFKGDVVVRCVRCVWRWGMRAVKWGARGSGWRCVLAGCDDVARYSVVGGGCMRV